MMNCKCGRNHKINHQSWVLDLKPPSIVFCIECYQQPIWYNCPYCFNILIQPIPLSEFINAR